jgi:hydroxyacylglutathione hydrolase
VLIITSQDPHNLSNSYLVGDKIGGPAVLIDGGTPTSPIHSAIEESDLSPSHLFVTHRHPDHIQFKGEYASRYGIPICGHRAESAACGGFDMELDGGERFEVGELRVQALHIPGHTAGHIAVFIEQGDERAVFPADTLFKGTVGGTRGVGNTGFDDLRHSILEVLLKLPADTVIYPGHSGPSTIGAERDSNPYVNAWTAADLPAGQPGTFRGEALELLLRGPDYDGGTKCWVRWPSTGQFDVLPGSQVVSP